jgi:hypothetical protein
MIDDTKAVSQGYVYILKSKGLYKIGSTKNISQRLHAYDFSNPDFRLIFHIKVYNHTRLEKSLHYIFYKKRVFGEWSKLTPGCIKKIKHLCSFEVVSGDNMK